MKTENKWVLDPEHSEITFNVKHLMISKVKGEFRSFDASLLSSEGDFNNASVNVTLVADSISTNNGDRDQHLKSSDFFDTANHKEVIFKGSSMIKLDEQNYQLKGLLTIKALTKNISLDVEFGGISKDPWGNIKAGFSVSGKINRKDWGLTWNSALETGGVMLSEEVKINAEMQFIQKS